jgi:hypothetical protein
MVMKQKSQRLGPKRAVETVEKYIYYPEITFLMESEISILAILNQSVLHHIILLPE